MRDALNKERMVLLFACGALALFLVGAELWPSAGGQASAPRGIGKGKVIKVDITLVTADSHDLACAGNHVVGDARCAFDKEGAPVTRGGAVLAPYMTVGNALLLIPDLFDEPAIAQRLAEEPPAGKARNDLRRFVASCDLEGEEKVKDFFVRWMPTGAWQHRTDAWVGRISGCTIRDAR